MVIARLTKSKKYKAKVYKTGTLWYIKYNWLNSETHAYPSWEKAYKQAFLKTSLTRRWF